MAQGPLNSDIAHHIWDSKYRYREGEVIHDRTIEDSWRRVARSVAAVERDSTLWEAQFYAIFDDLRFIPGGRILAGAGTRRHVTLFNCFVMGRIEDSMDGIFDALKEGALTMQQGGGVGYDFSTLRPNGSRARHTGSIASGPVSFMRIWDSMCGTILSTGARRGAMMATLRCDHADIEAFIEAKRDPQALRHFNLSVQVTDDFMRAVKEDADWPLLFPAESIGGEGELIKKEWPGHEGKVACRVLKRVSARQLWERIMRATYDVAEPGVLFVDKVNSENNLWYRERISATNPCGEIPLPPYGACNLGSINLTRFVIEPFSTAARLDFEAIEKAATVAVRLLDNVIDSSHFPLEAQAQQARGSRRIGLGLTGLADALIMLNLHYDSDEGRAMAARLMESICHTAYRTSIELAKEKGSFPFFDREHYLSGTFIQRLPEDIRNGIREYGIRNSHLTAIAPTGTISLLAGNVSSGLEPVFRYRFQRRLLQRDGSYSEHEMSDYAYRLWRELMGDTPLPDCFSQVEDLTPHAHLLMQSVLQPLVDSAISKTINIPSDFPFERFKDIYWQAWEVGLKGCTTFRPNPVTGSVLGKALTATPCCSIEREGE